MTIKMKTPAGQIMSRIPEKDVAYHLKNGWVLVEKEIQDKPEKKKSVKAEVETDSTLDLNEEKQ
jgi:hypothetical protein|tara:strand:- start:157 stop:348 length:192 start_codon:yes stop_codon:yes gene_type:complete